MAFDKAPSPFLGLDQDNINQVVIPQFPHQAFKNYLHGVISHSWTEMSEFEICPSEI